MTKLQKIIHYEKTAESTWFHACGGEEDYKPFPKTLQRQPTIYKNIPYAECLSAFKRYFSGMEPTKHENIFIVDTYRLTTPKQIAIINICEYNMKIFLFGRYPANKRIRQIMADDVARSEHALTCL